MNESTRSRRTHDEDIENATVTNYIGKGDKVRLNEPLDYGGGAVANYYMPIPLEVLIIEGDKVYLGIDGKELLVAHINNVFKV